MDMQLTANPLKHDIKVVNAYKKGITPRELRTAWLSRIIIWFVIIIVMFPIVAIVLASISKGNSFTQTSILPEALSLDNYRKVLFETDFKIWTKNSLILCFTVAFLQLCFTIPAGFAFSKIKFAFRSKGLMGLLILQMFPSTMALPAILKVAYNHNGMDNYPVLILLLSGGSAYFIWLMKGHMDGIPTELIEAAYVDGSTTFQVFTRIILPLVRNIVLVIFLFAFISAYSEFLFSSALLKDPSNWTLALGMSSFIKDKFTANWTQYSAASVMASVPVVLLFISLQKFISKGLTAGSVKG